MPRHNLCPNPAVGVDVTGWVGGSTPVRTPVAGFPRPNVARYTAGTFLETPRAAVSPGQTITLSFYVQFPNAALNVGGNTYIAWHRANGSDISFDAASYLTNINAILRIDRTGTAPAEAASVSIVLDGTNFGSQTCDITALLAEPVGTLDTYADGDTPNWIWDGTPGLSTSSESPDQTINPDSISSTQSVGSPSLTPGPIGINPDGVPSAELVGSPTLMPGPVTIAPVGIASTASVGGPIVGRHTAPTSLAPHAVGGVHSLPPVPARLPS